MKPLTDLILLARESAAWGGYLACFLCCLVPAVGARAMQPESAVESEPAGELESMVDEIEARSEGRARQQDALQRMLDNSVQIDRDADEIAEILGQLEVYATEEGRACAVNDFMIAQWTAEKQRYEAAGAAPERLSRFDRFMEEIARRRREQGCED